MPQHVKDTAGIIAWALAFILVFATLSHILSQSVCVFGLAKDPTFCTADALVGRRTFYLEVLASLGALWGAMKLVEKS